MADKPTSSAGSGYADTMKTPKGMSVIQADGHAEAPHGYGHTLTGSANGVCNGRAVVRPHKHHRELLPGCQKKERKEKKKNTKACFFFVARDEIW